eukprot:scaffold5916_cov44-Cyclotella_meneghiniana.AAC.2
MQIWQSFVFCVHDCPEICMHVRLLSALRPQVFVGGGGWIPSEDGVHLGFRGLRKSMSSNLKFAPPHENLHAIQICVHGRTVGLA